MVTIVFLCLLSPGLTYLCHPLSQQPSTVPIVWEAFNICLPSDCRNELRSYFVLTLQNPMQLEDSDCDSSEGECSDATVRTNKHYSSATW